MVSCIAFPSDFLCSYCIYTLKFWGVRCGYGQLPSGRKRNLPPTHSEKAPEFSAHTRDYMGRVGDHHFLNKGAGLFSWLLTLIPLIPNEGRKDRTMWLSEVLGTCLITGTKHALNALLSRTQGLVHLSRCCDGVRSECWGLPEPPSGKRELSLRTNVLNSQWSGGHMCWDFRKEPMYTNPQRGPACLMSGWIFIKCLDVASTYHLSLGVGGLQVQRIQLMTDWPHPVWLLAITFPLYSSLPGQVCYSGFLPLALFFS